WILFAREARGHDASPATGPAAMLASFRGLLRIPLVQVILAMAVGVFVFNHSFTNWLPEMLRSEGMSASEAGNWAAVPTLVAIGAALTVPRFTSARWLTPVLVGVFVIWAASALSLAAGGVPEWIVMTGLGIGRGAAT